MIWFKRQPIINKPSSSSSTSTSREQPFRWEDSQRRVRVIFAGLTIADSTRVMRLQEYGRLPVYYFPLEDVRQEVLEASDHQTRSPLKGEASYWTIRVGNRVAHNAAWSYLSPLPARPSGSGLCRLVLAPDGCLVRRGRAGLCSRA